MKILQQLLKEFWLPLVLGVAWTTFNVIDRPDRWSVREILNVFGPTFFFMSWLVAQWYRVRKQQRVEDGLVEIQAGLRAIQTPLLPCGLYYTLKHQCKDEEIDRILTRYESVPVFDAEKSIAIPPLPPGMSEGRVLGKIHYLDYADGVVKAAGIFRAAMHPGYNAVHSEIKRRMRFLTADGLSKAQTEADHFLRPTVSVEVAFFFGGKRPDRTPSPSLILKSSPRSEIGLGATAILDNLLFADTGVKDLEVKATSDASWGISDLKGAYVRVLLEFFLLEGINDIPRESWPSLHNLQLWLGPRARHVMTFSPEHLRNQVVRESPNPIVRGKAKLVEVVFETRIDDDMYSKHLLSTG